MVTVRGAGKLSRTEPPRLATNKMTKWHNDEFEGAIRRLKNSNSILLSFPAHIPNWQIAPILVPAYSRFEAY
jgi:hypothetical protein